MKKLIPGVAAVVLIGAVAVVACKKNFDKGFNPRGTNAGILNLPVVTLPLTITEDRTLTSDTLYLLDGKCYVTNNAVLTIDAGTRIEGVKKSTSDSSSALIVTRGSRLEAIGDAENPVVFTSHEATPAVGDWGGVVLLGSAPLNRADTTIEGINQPSVPAGVDVNYGGGGAGQGNAHDNSGILNYVRIEYAGAAIAADNELNSLTLGGVGDGTVIDYVELAYGADDGIEFFGGTVNAKHLILVAPNDDGIDTDFGFNGKIQYAVYVLNPNPSIPYSANPNGSENDNNPTGALDQPFTQPVLSNVTIIGVSDSTRARQLGLLNGAHYRRSSKLIVRNSVFIGFPTGLNFQSATTQAAAANFQYNTVHAFSAVSSPAGILDATNAQVRSLVPNNSSVSLTDPFNLSDPDFRPTSTSPLLTAGTQFTGMPGYPGFFDSTSYRGAAAAGTGLAALWWKDTWTRYDY